MKRFKNNLLVADFDAKQQMAVDRAVSLTKQNEARLTVFSVGFCNWPVPWRGWTTVRSKDEKGTLPFYHASANLSTCLESHGSFSPESPTTSRSAETGAPRCFSTMQIAPAI